MCTTVQIGYQMAPEVADSAIDCLYPRCRTTDKDGNEGCSKNYACTLQNDRVAREIEDPALVPVQAAWVVAQPDDDDDE